MNKDLISKDLFGNDAGEDELPTILNSYFVEKPIFPIFYENSVKFSIAESKKGIGKSTLLRKTHFIKDEEKETFISSYVKGADIEPFCDFTKISPNRYINSWQQGICSLINNLVGSKLKFGFDSTKLDIISDAEIMGFRKKSLFNALLKRYEIKLNKNQIKLSETKNVDSYQLLKKYANSEENRIWLFIDDIDATYIDNEENRLILSSFFSACRKLTNDINGLYIRVSVRTDVWSLIKEYDEALDKCEQYIVKISWKKDEFKYILRKKIKSYFVRNYPASKKYDELLIKGDARELLGLVFRRNYRVGKKLIKVLKENEGTTELIEVIKNITPKGYHTKAALLSYLESRVGQEKLKDWIQIIEENIHSQPQFYLHKHAKRIEEAIFSFSNGRPRWAAQWCRLAAVNAHYRKVAKIANHDLRYVLTEYSGKRLNDLYREHRHQCKDLPKLVELFSYNKPKYTTEEIFDLITKKYFKKNGFPVIDGKKVNSLYDIINFLFRIDFIYHYIRGHNDKRSTNFYEKFEDRPNLIYSVIEKENSETIWSINLCYLNALRIPTKSIIELTDN